MSNKKITELTELLTVSSDDLMAIVDDPSGSPETKKITVANLISGTFDTRYLKLDGSNANTNIDVGAYSITANSFIGSGSGLTGLDGTHFHDGDTLQCDGITSDGGVFNLRTSDDLVLYPNGATTTSYNFNVQGGYAYLTLRSPDQTLHIEGLNVDVVGFSLDGDATHYTKLQTYPNLEYTELFCSHPLHIITNADATDYLTISTASNQTTINFTGQNGKITADSGAISFDNENLDTTGDIHLNSTSNKLYVGTSKNNYIYNDGAVLWVRSDAADFVGLYSADGILFQANGDEDDFLYFSTVSNVPTITTVGGCDLKITASSGTIDFDNEDLITTGRLGVGSNVFAVDVNGITTTAKFLSVVDSAATTVAAAFSEFGNTAAKGCTIYGARSRGNVAGFPTIVQDDDNIFDIIAVGNDGVDFAQAARIDFEVDGTPGSNDMPGRIKFSTTPDGSQVPIEAMRIDSSGNINFSDGDLTTTGEIKIDSDSSKLYLGDEQKLHLSYDGSDAYIINATGTMNIISPDMSIICDSLLASIDGVATIASLDQLILASNAEWIDLQTNSTSRLYIENGGNIGIGIASSLIGHLHLKKNDCVATIEDSGIGDTTITTGMHGLQLLTGGMNTSSKWGTALKFMSTDPNFTTTNPKFLAGIIPRSTETYAADSDSGMVLDFCATADNQGSVAVCSVYATVGPNYFEIPYDLRHTGDTNTYLRFTADQIDLVAGGLTFLRMDEASIDVLKVNPNQSNIDFVVNTDTKTNAISIDATDNTFFSTLKMYTGYGVLTKINEGAAIGGTLYSAYVNQGNVGAGVDTLGKYSLVKGQLDQVGDYLTIRAWGITAANGNNKQVKLTYGSTEIYATGAAAENNLDWFLEATILLVDATNQSAVAELRATTVGWKTDPLITSPAETAANAIDIDISGEATANDDIVLKGFIIEWGMDNATR